jgi:predicted alpha/beta hydrolase family esterase
MTPSCATLIIPGIGNSGPEHWQSRWERTHPGLRRVQMPDWDQPERDQWVARLEATVHVTGPDVVLVGHSLGCLLVAHWAQISHLRVRGALLVAAPDPAGALFPAAAKSFGPAPLVRLPFPSVLVVSENDPYGSPLFAQTCARAWGSRMVSIGPAGHINASSGLGDWPFGLELLASLLPA